MANTIKLGNGNWATKEGSLLAYNDERNAFKPLPFTTTRASSASVVNKQGLIETVGSGIPRIDYKDDSKGALLLEPTRSNLLPYSDDFSNSNWVKSRSTFTIDSIQSPSGLINMGYLTEDTTANNTHYMRGFLTVTDGVNYTLSVFAKAKERGIICLGDNAAIQASTGVWFDLTNGLVLTQRSGYVGSIKDFGNGIYRCSVTYSASASRQYVDIALSLSDGVNVYTGDNTSGAYLWGAQVEQGSYATSYIPTQETTQTRVADTASLLNLDTNNLVTDSGSWTVLFELELLSNETSMDKIRLTDVSGNPRAYLYHSSIGAVGTDWTGGTSITMNTNNKIIYRANSAQDITVFKNGVNAVTLASTSTPIVFNRILLNGSNGAFKVKQMQVFNTTLSDTECINLTTI